MTLRRKIGGVCAATTVGVVGIALSAAPVSAETYEVNCTFMGLPVPFNFDITAAAPEDAVPAGESFTLTDLTVVQMIDGTVDHSLEVTLLGQAVDLGRVGPSAPGVYTWGPMDVELTAPSVEGVVEVGIAPESAVDIQHTANDVEFLCAEFPDTPFASVTVAGDEPPTSTTTPGSGGNGGGGDGAGGGVGGGAGGGGDDGSGGSGSSGDGGSGTTPPAAVPVPGQPSLTG